VTDGEAYNEAVYWLTRLSPGELVLAISKHPDIREAKCRSLKNGREKVQFSIERSSGEVATKKTASLRPRPAAALAEAEAYFPPENG